MSRRTVLAPAARFRPVAAAVVLLVLPGCPDVGERSVDDAGFPALRTEVLVDDEDGEPGFSTTGDDWTTWGTNGYGFDGSDTSYHYLSHTLGGDDRRGTATWSPTLPEAGTYRIETWFRRTENRTDDTFGDDDTAADDDGPPGPGGDYGDGGCACGVRTKGDRPVVGALLLTGLLMVIRGRRRSHR